MGFYTTFRLIGISSGTFPGGAALNYFGFGTCFYLTKMSVLIKEFGLGLAIVPLFKGFLVIPFFELPFIFFTLLLLPGAWVVIH